MSWNCRLPSLEAKVCKGNGDPKQCFTSIVVTIIGQMLSTEGINKICSWFKYMWHWMSPSISWCEGRNICVVPFPKCFTSSQTSPEWSPLNLRNFEIFWKNRKFSKKMGDLSILGQWALKFWKKGAIFLNGTRQRNFPYFQLHGSGQTSVAPFRKNHTQALVAHGV